VRKLPITLDKLLSGRSDFSRWRGRINKVILAGMLANLGVESRLRELLEQGFEVAVVKDATAAPRHQVR